MKFANTLLIIVFGCSILASSLSCDGRTLLANQDTNLTNDLILSNRDIVLAPAKDTSIVPDQVKGKTIILVRHAEKSKMGKDPELTPEGIERAERLAHMLSEIELDEIYSTNYKRTMQTAMPTAENHGLTISTYSGFDHDDLINKILDNVNVVNVLIVGHSNTTPNFLNALTETSNYPDLTEDDYDNLFIVNTKSKGDCEVIHLKF